MHYLSFIFSQAPWKRDHRHIPSTHSKLAFSLPAGPPPPCHHCLYHCFSEAASDFRANPRKRFYTYLFNSLRPVNTLWYLFSLSLSALISLTSVPFVTPLSPRPPSYSRMAAGCQDCPPTPKGGPFRVLLNSLFLSPSSHLLNFQPHCLWL